MEKETPVGPGPARVLRELASTDGALTLADLGERTGLHQNTLRAHLATLLEAGRISRSPVRAAGRGRPRWGYVVRPDEHATLARALVAGLVGLDKEVADQAALRGGRAWGRQVVEDVGLGGAGPRERTREVLAHTGFAPEDTATRDAVGSPESSASPIRLTRCPIVDVARDHPQIVCRVHQGMLEGALMAGAGTPAQQDAPGVRLAPFAEPGACWVLLGQPGLGAPGRA